MCVCVCVRACVRAYLRGGGRGGVFISGDVFFPPFLPVNSLVFLVKDFIAATANPDNTALNISVSEVVLADGSMTTKD